MLVLKETEICPYRNRCPYNTNLTCYGSKPERLTTFTCKYVDEKGNITEGMPERLSNDITGQMKILME